jgi:hypothetical protein
MKLQNYLQQNDFANKLEISTNETLDVKFI